jgi:hypothetical protein
MQLEGPQIALTETKQQMSRGQQWLFLQLKKKSAQWYMI